MMYFSNESVSTQYLQQKRDKHCVPMCSFQEVWVIDIYKKQMRNTVFQGVGLIWEKKPLGSRGNQSSGFDLHKRL
jgi:hypothetical protein